MDKKTIVAYVLIFLVLMGWLMYSSVHKNYEQQSAAKNQTQLNKTGNNSNKIDTVSNNNTQATKNVISKDSLESVDKYGASLAPFSKGNEEIITIETDLVIAKFSSKGGVLKSWTLKNFKKWDKVPSQLIWDNDGELFITITSREAGRDTVDTRNLFFNFVQKPKSDYIRLSGNDSLTLTAKLSPDSSSAIIKTFTLHGNTYDINTDIVMQNMDKYIRQKKYDFVWKNGLRYQEINSVGESDQAHALVVTNGEVNELNATKNDIETLSPPGTIDYAAAKIKYFGMAMIPQPFRGTDFTVRAEGHHEKVGTDGVIEYYNIVWGIPYQGGIQKSSFKVYLGPLDYGIVKQYGLSELINFGWKWIVRPIGEFIMLPFFKMTYSFIPNFGIAILVFSLVLKFILYPLSITQMKSAQKMKLVNPEIADIRKRLKDDPKKQQAEIMKIYSEYGVNPASGCLPLLLQMPILYALWAVLSNSIDLRQADFIWWIKDLSLPDVIVTLPIAFPVKHISGLALIMGLTMFIQQKMTMTDPNQKAMIYVMPIMFTVMFSYFPAGLNLYYFMFNLIGIAQQIWIEKFSRKKLSLADLKKAPKKEGWLQKKMREAQEIAQAQGKTLPGQNFQNKNNNGRQNFNNRKNNKKK